MPATTPHLTLDRKFLDAVTDGTPYNTIVADDEQLSEFAFSVLPEACGYDLTGAYVDAQEREDGDVVIMLVERYEEHLRACTSFDQAFEVVKLLAAAMTLIAPPA